MATTQYIGARYVPKFYENPSNTSDWTPNTQYEPLTIVTRNGNSYTSKKSVPASVGEPENNPTYWASTGTYNQQVESYRQEVVEYKEDVEEYRDEVQEYHDEVRDWSNIEPVCCVLRKNNGVWQILPASSGHTPKHITGVTVDQDGCPVLTFDKTYSSVGTITICPDEAYGLAGLGAGASVGVSNMKIHLYRTRAFSGWFDFTNTGAISYPSPNAQYKGDIDTVEYTAANNLFKVKFKDYADGGVFNYINFDLSKDAINAQVASKGAFNLTTVQFTFANSISGMTNGGRVWVTASKCGYDLTADEFPEVEYGNFWITGFMIK